MKSQPNKCVQCGNCCRTRAIDIAYSDIKRWEEQERWDILREVYLIDNYPIKGCAGFYFEKSLKKRSDMERYCPFLEFNRCKIHDTKPGGCRDAPLAYTDFPECPVFKELPEMTVRLMRGKQDKDIEECKINQLEVRDILIKAHKCQ